MMSIWKPSPVQSLNKIIHGLAKDFKIREDCRIQPVQQAEVPNLTVQDALRVCRTLFALDIMSTTQPNLELAYELYGGGDFDPEVANDYGYLCFVVAAFNINVFLVDKGFLRADRDKLDFYILQRFGRNQWAWLGEEIYNMETNLSLAAELVLGDNRDKELKLVDLLPKLAYIPWQVSVEFNYDNLDEAQNIIQYLDRQKPRPLYYRFMWDTTLEPEDFDLQLGAPVAKYQKRWLREPYGLMWLNYLRNFNLHSPTAKLEDLELQNPHQDLDASNDRKEVDIEKFDPIFTIYGPSTYQHVLSFFEPEWLQQHLQLARLEQRKGEPLPLHTVRMRQCLPQFFGAYPLSSRPRVYHCPETTLRWELMSQVMIYILCGQQTPFTYWQHIRLQDALVCPPPNQYPNVVTQTRENNKSEFRLVAYVFRQNWIEYYDTAAQQAPLPLDYRYDDYPVLEMIRPGNFVKCVDYVPFFLYLAAQCSNLDQSRRLQVYLNSTTLRSDNQASDVYLDLWVRANKVLKKHRRLLESKLKIPDALRKALKEPDKKAEALFIGQILNPRAFKTPATVTIKPSDIEGAGQGVFAARDIRKDTILGTYKGKRYTPEQYDAKYSDDDFREYAMTAYSRRGPKRALFVIDAEDPTKSNWTRFINHSDDPNVEFITHGRNILVKTIKDIRYDQELLADYGPEYLESARRAGRVFN